MARVAAAHTTRRAQVEREAAAAASYREAYARHALEKEGLLSAAIERRARDCSAIRQRHHDDTDRENDLIWSNEMLKRRLIEFALPRFLHRIIVAGRRKNFSKKMAEKRAGDRAKLKAKISALPYSRFPMFGDWLSGRKGGVFELAKVHLTNLAASKRKANFAAGNDRGQGLAGHPPIARPDAMVAAPPPSTQPRKKPHTGTTAMAPAAEPQGTLSARAAAQKPAQAPFGKRRPSAASTGKSRGLER